jgi:ADP-heptose:LPS heptosyltransferase
VILVLRALGVGDLATAVPALRGLRTAFPGRTLALAVPPWLAPLVGCVGGIDRVVPLDGLDRSAALPAAQLAVNLHGCGPESHRLLQASAPARMWAYACPDAGFTDGPVWTDDEHEVARYCRLLSYYGVACSPDDLALRRPAPDRVPVGVTVLHPGAKAPERQWPVERFGDLARRLATLGHRVVVTGSPSEHGLAARVAALGGLPGTAVYAGRTDVADLAALVAYARLVVCGDTGAAHLATAYGTPSVVLFAGMSPARWGPPPDRPQHHVVWRPALAGLPAPADGPHPALAAIEVDDVMEALGAAAAR